MNMKKWIAAAIACSALTLSACGGQSKDAAASPAANTGKVYRVASNAEFAPFEWPKKAILKSNSNTSLGTVSFPL